MQTIILSSRNPSKIAQIKPFFEDLPVVLRSLDEAGIAGDAIENGDTLEENALKKVLFARAQTTDWVVADDTGLFIDALDGKPGVHSARWAGPDATTEDILAFVLAQLKDIPLDQRTATFRTVAIVLDPTGATYAFEGVVPGILLTEPRVPPQPKMPYSAIFQPLGRTKTWAEMTVEEENAISHRGAAFRKVREFFLRTLSA